MLKYGFFALPRFLLFFVKRTKLSVWDILLHRFYPCMKRFECRENLKESEVTEDEITAGQHSGFDH